jgi:hypothetical protein
MNSVSWLHAHRPTPTARIDVRTEDDRQLVWSMIVEIGLNERHFNQLQSFYRTLTSTWLLGLFTAAGFLLSKKESDLPINPGAVLAFLGLIAGVGIVLLWLMDLKVYAGLLRAFLTQESRWRRSTNGCPQSGRPCCTTREI